VPDLDEEFAEAARTATSLTRDPGNETKLRLYALYKQATSGDVEGRRPGFIDPVGRSKHDAWARVAGTPPQEAKRAYVALVAQLTGSG